MMKKVIGYIKHIPFLVIFAIGIAGFLRFWKLGEYPYPPNGDELAFGYYGWSLLHFATDEYGRFLPLNFPSIGDFKYPGLAYLNILPALLFGLTPYMTRVIDALSGTILPLILFEIARRLSRNKTIAITSACFAALSPWSILESRLGYENHLSMVLISLGVLFFLISTSSKEIKMRKRYTLLSLGFFGYALFTYAAARVFIPLFFFSLFALSLYPIELLKNAKKQIVFLLAATTLITISLFMQQGGNGRAREDVWHGISQQEKQELQKRYVEAGISPVRIPPRVTWLFNNKYLITMRDFLERYVDHFSPRFLFFEGEASLERIPGTGVLLLVDLMLLPIGVMALFLGRNKSPFVLILFWILIAPIASALTYGGAHINRASLMIPPLTMISAIGYEKIISLFTTSMRRVVTFMLVLLTGGSLLLAMNLYFVHKPVDQPWVREVVAQELTKEILNRKDTYDAVVMNEDDYMYFLFYGKISPEYFWAQADIEPLNYEKPWKRVDRFENIYFKMPFRCPKSGKEHVLYVCEGNEVPQNATVIKTLYFPDGVPAFTLIEFYPLTQMQNPLPELPKDVHYMVDVERKEDFPDGIIPLDYPSYW